MEVTVPIVAVMNFGIVMESIRPLLPDAVNCDGIAIMNDSRTAFWSLNLTVKNADFPDPKNPEQANDVKNILQRGMKSSGIIRHVNQIILNLPSGTIYKWQTLSTMAEWPWPWPDDSFCAIPRDLPPLADMGASLEGLSRTL
ncbi:unnamed protein product, partial [Brenthis ino]